MSNERHKAILEILLNQQRAIVKDLASSISGIVFASEPCSELQKYAAI